MNIDFFFFVIEMRGNMEKFVLVFRFVYEWVFEGLEIMFCYENIVNVEC